MHTLCARAPGVHAFCATQVVNSSITSSHAKYVGGAIFMPDGLRGVLQLNRSVLAGGRACSGGGVYLGGCANEGGGYSLGEGASLLVRACMTMGGMWRGWMGRHASCWQST